MRLVHACVVIETYTPMSLPRSVADAMADLGRSWLAEAAAEARELAPDLDISTELLHRDPRTVLLAEAESARLVVVGSRGLGGFTELLVGSIAVALASHGQCPVVVVRGEDEDRTGMPVVVGIDGSPGAEAALGFACEQASRLGVPLVAVHTWTDVVSSSIFATVPYAVDWLEVRTEELQVLSERLAGWQEKYPEVKVRRVVTRDHPARSLIDEAGDAQLVVVGSRGRGGIAGLLLGSTSQALLHHAPCPVAVVRPS